MTSSGPERRWWFRQLPNSITLIRILLVPVVIWLLFTEWDSTLGRLVALVIFVISAATDGLDGGIARKYQIESNFGRLLDPIADKVLLGGSLIALSILNQVPWLATVLILFRELGITVYRLAVAKRRVISANSGGKFKTVIQIVVISLVILPAESLVPFWSELIVYPIWFAVLVTLFTAVGYWRPSIQARGDESK